MGRKETGSSEGSFLFTKRGQGGGNPVPLTQGVCYHPKAQGHEGETVTGTWGESRVEGPLPRATALGGGGRRLFTPPTPNPNRTRTRRP